MHLRCQIVVTQRIGAASLLALTLPSNHHPIEKTLRVKTRREDVLNTSVFNKRAQGSYEMNTAVSAIGKQPAAASAPRDFGQTFAWSLVACLFLIDVVWCKFTGLAISGTWKIAGTLSLLLAVFLIYRGRSGSIADWAEGLALWVAFTTAGCVLTYLCATCALPLQDEALAEIDQTMGFDWLRWRHVVVGWPALYCVLVVAYGSLFWQILFSVLYLPINGHAQRGRELFILAALTIVPTAAISALLPALGPFTEAHYVAHVLSLRAAGPWEFDLSRMDGIITMPSYHTIQAVLLTYAYRGTGMVGWSIAGLNGVMLLSISPIGGHYLIDMIVGGAIAVLFVVGFRWWLARTPLQSETGKDHHGYRLARSLGS
jgi:hypothetical protein